MPAGRSACSRRAASARERSRASRASSRAASLPGARSPRHFTPYTGRSARRRSSRRPRARWRRSIPTRPECWSTCCSSAAGPRTRRACSRWSPRATMSPKPPAAPGWPCRTSSRATLPPRSGCASWRRRIPRRWHSPRAPTRPTRRPSGCASTTRSCGTTATHLEARDLRALLLTQLNRHAEARAACRKTAAEKEAPAALRARAAWIEASLGRVAEARRMMRAAVKDHPLHRWAWDRLLEWDFQEDGASPSYLADARAHCEVYPGEPSAHGYLGDALRRSGRPREAEAAFRRGVELDPAYEWGRLALADLLLDEGRARDATEALEGPTPTPPVLIRLIRGALASDQAGARRVELRRAARPPRRRTTTCGAAVGTRSSRPRRATGLREAFETALAGPTAPDSAASLFVEWLGSQKDWRGCDAALARLATGPSVAAARRSRRLRARPAGGRGQGPARASREAAPRGASLRRLPVEPHRPRDLARRRPCRGPVDGGLAEAQDEPVGAQRPRDLAAPAAPARRGAAREPPGARAARRSHHAVPPGVGGGSRRRSRATSRRPSRCSTASSRRRSRRPSTTRWPCSRAPRS